MQNQTNKIEKPTQVREILKIKDLLKEENLQLWKDTINKKIYECQELNHEL